MQLTFIAFAGLSLPGLLSPFAMVLDEGEASLGLFLELTDLFLDIVSVFDFLMVVEQAVGGWLRILEFRV